MGGRSHSFELDSSYLHLLPGMGLFPRLDTSPVNSSYLSRHDMFSLGGTELRGAACRDALQCLVDGHVSSPNLA